jgi:catechol 2,3-dioxygenase-like lactoylglutathione lyase family enzyme
MAVTRIGRISFTTSDADRLGAFYRQACFEPMEIERRTGTSFARLTGVEDAQARVVPLRLGEETIELLAFTEPGAPYPADIGCDDPRFQHIAIVVADVASLAFPPNNVPSRWRGHRIETVHALGSITPPSSFGRLC